VKTLVTDTFGEDFRRLFQPGAGGETEIDEDTPPVSVYSLATYMSLFNCYGNPKYVGEY